MAASNRNLRVHLDVSVSKNPSPGRADPNVMHKQNARSLSDYVHQLPGYVRFRHSVQQLSHGWGNNPIGCMEQEYADYQGADVIQESPLGPQ